jgi:proteic killer suppression protein
MLGRDQELRRPAHCSGIPGARAERVPPIIAQRAQTKLAVLDAAASLAELRVPPGNRLEALKGARRGQHSIRINEQWRICFVWQGGNAHEVEIVDYH